MFYQLPPVGNKVCLSSRQDSEAGLQVVLESCSARYFQSGTAALAASIAAAVKLKGAGCPEVILPAYGCPDLVSAAVFTGAKPVLVDFEVDRPWMNLDQVAGKITQQTVAVIAASLCGIPERLADLREITERSAIMLIEDSAQLFPASHAAVDWQGDMTVLSFGRGKPVNLLGGGAVLYKDHSLAKFLPDLKPLPLGFLQSQTYRLKAFLYNQIISPRRYWALSCLPFLHIGETRYRELAGLEPLNRCRWQHLGASVAHYQSQSLKTQAALSRIIDEQANARIVNLPVACQLQAKQRLLRYPLLVEPGLRGKVYKRLSTDGMGVSTMYPVTLPGIQGLETLLSGQGPFPEAERFTRRFLTLPTHAGVRPADIQTIAAGFVAEGA